MNKKPDYLTESEIQQFIDEWISYVPETMKRTAVRLQNPPTRADLNAALKALEDWAEAYAATYSVIAEKAETKAITFDMGNELGIMLKLSKFTRFQAEPTANNIITYCIDELKKQNKIIELFNEKIKRQYDTIINLEEQLAKLDYQ